MTDSENAKKISCQLEKHESPKTVGTTPFRYYTTSVQWNATKTNSVFTTINDTATYFGFCCYLITPSTQKKNEEWQKIDRKATNRRITEDLQSKNATNCSNEPYYNTVSKLRLGGPHGPQPGSLLVEVSMPLTDDVDSSSSHCLPRRAGYSETGIMWGFSCPLQFTIISQAPGKLSQKFTRRAAFEGTYLRESRRATMVGNIHRFWDSRDQGSYKKVVFYLFPMFIRLYGILLRRQSSWKLRPELKSVIIVWNQLWATSVLPGISY